jgi:hypothetical protein
MLLTLLQSNAPAPSVATKVWLNVSGVWKQVIVWKKVTGVWKQITVWRNVAGVWK